MKIKEIKSAEVRNEAVRLAIEKHPQFRTKKIVLGYGLFWAFSWKETPQNHEFWSDLQDGIIANKPDLKLPNL